MEGIIIKISDYKDNSKILNVFTPNGIESLIARGVKKLNSSLVNVCQTYNRISYVRTEKEMYTLIEGNVIDYLEDVKFDYEKCEILSLIFKHLYYINEFNDLLYMFILKTIEALKIYDPKNIYLMFKIKFLYFLGINPQFSCKCGNKNNLVNITLDGYCLCSNCTSSNNKSLVESIYNSYYDKSFSYNIDSINFVEVYNFIKDYYFIHLNIRIKGEDTL